MTVQKDDIVRFLNAVGGGRVTRVEGNMAYVEDEDGFETPALVRECVVVGHASATPKAAPAPVAAPAPAPQPRTMTVQPEPEPEPVIEETPEGEKLNVVLAYEPRDIKAPTTSEIDTYIVNDSNYYLAFSYMTRSADDSDWTLRYAGTVEPNIQLLLGELDRAALPEMDRVMVQWIAYKQDKPFAAKQPGSVEFKLDTTKFFKLHCYRDNEYFETPVIAFDLVRDDQLQRQPAVDAKALTDAMNAKKAVDRQRRPVQKKRAKARLQDGIVVVDLHIQELIDNTRGLSNADMLNLQVDEFRRVMDANLRNKGMKIVFIHGKGEGVLRKALMKELNHRYKGHDVQDASFSEYGFGATQVTIR